MPGLTPDDKAYFANRALSKHAIDLLLECPARYREWELSPDEDTSKSTPALEFGTFVHMMTLQPDEVSKYYIRADKNYATKEGKAFKAECAEKGLTAWKSDDWIAASQMAWQVRNYPALHPLFCSSDYVAEAPIEWEFEGIACKGKPDAVATMPSTGFRYIIDLKTTVSAAPDDLGRIIAKYKYYRQAAWYLTGMELVGKPCAGFIFAFVEKTAPYIVTAAMVDSVSLARGLEECRRAIQILKECREKDYYPCYTREVIEISVPAWGFTQNADDEAAEPEPSENIG